MFDKLIHHINSICGLTLSLYGYNIGVLNNLIKNEVSTIWLSLMALSYSSTNILFKKLNPIFIILFIITFINYRIIPCSTIMYVMLINVNSHIYTFINIIHFIIFFIHLMLQYYWFLLIIKKLYNIIYRKLFHFIS